MNDSWTLSNCWTNLQALLQRDKRVSAKHQLYFHKLPCRKYLVKEADGAAEDGRCLRSTSRAISHSFFPLSFFRKRLRLSLEP